MTNDNNAKNIMPFDVNAYLSDTELLLSSMSAQGLWARLLMWMWKSEYRGKLYINGKQPTSKNLATLCGTTEQEINKLIEELKKNKVCDVFADGTIINRRMYEPERKKRELSKKRAEAGHKGGVAHSKQKDSKIKKKVSGFGYVYLTKEELDRLVKDYGKKIVKIYIERLNNYIGSQGLQNKYVDHNLTIRNWMNRDNIAKKEVFEAPMRARDDEQKRIVKEKQAQDKFDIMFKALSPEKQEKLKDEAVERLKMGKKTIISRDGAIMKSMIKQILKD